MNIGIIGSSDGPTSIYVASDKSSFVIVGAAIIGIAVILIVRSIKKQKR